MSMQNGKDRNMNILTDFLGGFIDEEMPQTKPVHVLYHYHPERFRAYRKYHSYVSDYYKKNVPSDIRSSGRLASNLPMRALMAISHHDTELTKTSFSSAISNSFTGAMRGPLVNSAIPTTFTTSTAKVGFHLSPLGIPLLYLASNFCFSTS